MPKPNKDGHLPAYIVGICGIVAAIVAGLFAWHNEYVKPAATPDSAQGFPSAAKVKPLSETPAASPPPNKAYVLTGQIRDAKTSVRIVGAEVTVKWNGAIDSARTDDNGVYKLVLNNPPDNFTIDVDASGYKSVIDENHSSKIENGTDTWNKMLTPIATAPSPAPAQASSAGSSGPSSLSHVVKDFSVSGRCGLNSVNGFATGLTIQKGDYISVTASDDISVGPNIGSTGPDGVNFIKIPIIGPQPINPGYYILSDIGLGGLLWRIGTNGSWHPCGSAKEWTAKTSGQLYFNVNDKIQSDNSGDFTVNVDVAHHGG